MVKGEIICFLFKNLQRRVSVILGWKLNSVYDTIYFLTVIELLSGGSGTVEYSTVE
jgi:hypothetical protein